jgi:hypothetical protein
LSAVGPTIGRRVDLELLDRLRDGIECERVRRLA